MKCPVCGTENEEGASFCFRCGSPLQPQPVQPATGQTVMLSSDPTASGSARTYATPSTANLAPDPRYGSDIDANYSIPTGQPQAYVMPGGSYIPVTNTSAILSLVMSVLSYFLLPFIGSVIGIILGYQARRSIRASNGRQTGEGLATAGIVIGWIHIALFLILALVLCVVFGLLGNAARFR
ncbi:MAG: DUF4190 domain-containing protein [Herpetosiphonaceae bacterium]|nr:DUF4190 domain-containing protein [Herpetosiphonaceae bacterium]